MTFLVNIDKEYAPPPQPGEYPTVGNSLNSSAILNLFKNKKVSDLVKPLAFQNTKIAIEASLQQRLTLPEKIDQGNTSLCGPAAFFYCLASRHPELYARYMVEMALFGKVHLSLGGGSRSNGLTVEASASLLQPCPGIDIVDWLTLGSLRRWDNPVSSLACESSNMNDFASITKPESLASWFRRIGCSEVLTDVQVLSNTQEAENLKWAMENLILAQNKLTLGHSVCLLIQSNVLEAYIYHKPLRSPNFYPDHWIVLTSKIQLDGIPLFPNATRNPKVASSLKGLTFQVYSWGGNIPVKLNPRYFSNTTMVLSQQGGRK